MTFNKYKIKKILLNNGIIIAMLLLIIVTGIIETNFFSIKNLVNVLRQVSIIGIISCGMTYCIIAGLFDLSVGSIVSLSGVIAILSINAGSNEYIAILYALLAGLGVGIINGTLVSIINGRSGEAFIVTYGTQVVVASIALFPSNGLFIAGHVKPGFFKTLGSGFSPIIIFLLVAVILQLILRKTQYGRKLCFIGNNINAAKMSGIKIVKNRISYFAISGFLASLAGIVLCSRVTSSNPTAGLYFEMDAIAAIVVGGTSMSGGSGSVIRTAIGAIVLGVMSNALNILGITAYHQQIVKGLLIVFAVAFDIYNKVKNEKELPNAKK